ncbi:hypothetical protein DLJ53_21960 [Acuticoccus sediminis]|uniref:Uncharacterized protein n=1 Tax=Acuticoccus sediminis TaxID=2184697 RepID=A0A8B2NQC9_9HYPH|nr:hypothetical protein DLJ53_21960 [Acuticoccus sediminis]
MANQAAHHEDAAPWLLSAIDSTLTQHIAAGCSRREAAGEVVNDLSQALGTLLGELATSEQDLFNRNAYTGRLTQAAARVAYSREVRRAARVVCAPPHPRRLR